MRTLKVVRASVIVALSLSYFAHAFRLPDDTVLKSGLGDWLDPYFINYLLEHWHHSLWSLTDPASPPMYFPARGTLGYSHGLILYAPFYLAVRPFLHPFHAYSATIFLVLETGSLCLYVLFRKFLGLRFVESLLLSAFFCSSANVINGATGVWTQRASVFLIPPIILLAVVSYRKRPGRQRLLLAWIAGLLSTLLFTQDFYTGQFALLLLALLLAGVLPLACWRLGSVVVDLWRAAASATETRGDSVHVPRSPSPWWPVVACVSLVWAVAIWFHPIARTTVGALTFSARDPTRPFVIALLTSGWFVFRRSRLGQRLERRLRGIRPRLLTSTLVAVAFGASGTARIRGFWKRDGPHALAMAVGSLVGGVVFLWIYLGSYREHPAFPADQLMNSLGARDPSRWRRPLDFLSDLGAYDTLRSFKLVFLVGVLAWVPWFRVDRKSRLFGVWFMSVSCLVLLVAVRFNDFSIWKAAFASLPGFSAIRDPKRIIEVYELVVVLLAGLLLARLPTRSLLRASIVVLLLVLIPTDLNWQVFDFRRPIGVYDRWVEAPIDIDRTCESFFIKGASPQYMSRSPNMWGLYGIDSMFVALNHSLPTLNGYSAWGPDGWELANPQEPSYADRVAVWIERHDLRGVCEFDIEKRTMAPYRPASARE